MQTLTNADQIWNRACQGGGTCPKAGDVALAAVLLFHGAAMNGGVLHAVQCLSPLQLQAARMGYAFYGFSEIDELLERAQCLQDSQELESLEQELNQGYWRHIPDDASLVDRFERHWKTSPGDFASTQEVP